MVWVIGSSGMLGAEVCKALEKERVDFIASASDVDARDFDEIKKFAENWENQRFSMRRKNGERPKIKWIVNCAAYTDVEQAELDTELAEALNVLAPANIARLARFLGARLIHISTDYVFDGKAKTPYSEDAPKNPLGVYARTKSQGEDEIRRLMTQFYIVRSSWLYGFGRPNFVTKMARLMSEKNEIKVVSDQCGSPTFTADLAAAILKIIKTTEKVGANLLSKNAIPYGIYNFADAGETSWHGFALEIQRLLKKHRIVENACDVLPCASSEHVSRVERPAYSVLNTAKIQKILKIKIPKWRDSLERFIKDADFKII